MVRKVTPRKDFSDLEDEPVFLEEPEDSDDDDERMW